MESMALIRYIKNSRNTETLIAGEFMFRKNKCRDEKVYWKCRKSGCNAKITTHNGKVVGYFLKHNHVDNNHDEIVRLEGLHSRNNQPQVTQVENVIHQEIVTPEESFVDYSFTVESIVAPTSESGGDAGTIVAEVVQRRVDEINGVKGPNGELTTNETTVAVATIEDPEAEADAATSSLTIMFKEFSESQKKIEQLVTNLVSPGESDDLQTENIRLKEQLEETVRKCKSELEAKEIAIQEQKSRAETLEKEMQARLAVERSIKEKLADENAELKLIVEHYEKKIKENVQRNFLFH